MPQGLGQSTDRVGPRPAHSVGGDVPDGQDQVVVVHGGAHQEPVEGGLPGVGPDGLGNAERSPVARVEAPPDTSPVDPVGDVIEVVVVETEPLTNRSEGQEVQHRGSLEAAAGNSMRATVAFNSGLVDRIDWSAIRYRRAGAPRAADGPWCAGVPASADGPNTAWINGANVSMAGQTTRTSSSSSPRSGSLSRCNRTSRSTST